MSGFCSRHQGHDPTCNICAPDPIAEGLRLAESWRANWPERTGFTGEDFEDWAEDIRPYIVHAANHFPDLAREVVRLREALQGLAVASQCTHEYKEDCDCYDKVRSIATAALAAAEGRKA